MTQLYASFSTNLLPFISVLLFTEVAFVSQLNLKSEGVKFSVLSAFFGGLTAGQQAVAHNISNRIFTSQVSFHNYFLAYVSSHGSGGGGGGGGHGG
ncbi:hypothetical protein EZL74_11470 [Flavobacterium silvisoli]|uniref:Uncharacterized protein n=1 Tax=Flavobacterium silvisoli TaxID=2529433 RepID=A0A4Q9YR45_9FLAO|nr:hypothetical protein [Flavobacterium silvisoli]TBX65985.1 hypothetical protein EZL74_11470 [Flavobacterium silvisoli]